MNGRTVRCNKSSAKDRRDQSDTRGRASGTEEISSRPPDISPHGMFINTAKRFPEGAIMKLRFRLNRSGVEIHARAEVRYCLPGVGIGVEFVGLSPESVHAIEEEIAGTPVIG